MGPADHFINILSNITLTCASTGYPPPSISWFKNDQLLIGRNLSFLAIPKAELTDRGFYHCVAVNSVGNATSRRAVVNFKSK